MNTTFTPTQQLTHAAIAMRGRYENDSLPYALATLAAIKLNVAGLGSFPSVTQLGNALKRAGAPVPGRNRLASIIASVQKHVSSRSPVSAPAAARARLVVSLVIAGDLETITVGRSATARRALAVIGLQWILEVEFERVIVSSGWLAEQLHVGETTAARAISDLVAARVLVGEKKLRDGRTRAFKLNSKIDSVTVLGALAWTGDIETLAAGESPEPDSVADVLRGAGSPVWALGSARAVNGGPWALALAESAKPAASELRGVALVEARNAAKRVGRAEHRGVAEAELAELRASHDRVRDLGSRAKQLVDRLKPASLGGPGRPTAGREWLAERPAEVSYGAWLEGLSADEELNGVVAERLKARAAEIRARRLAADQATGGKRTRQTPAEWVTD